MKQQYDIDLIINVIEAIEHLGIDGFYWGDRDENFFKSQDELINSVDKIITCLEWIDREYTLEAYIRANGVRASQIKSAIEAEEDIDIPLGCVITAIAFNHHRFRYLKTNGWGDIVFFAPANIVKELKYQMKSQNKKLSPEELQKIIEA